MVQWPGRRGKMIKWRTPLGKWASYAIYGTYAFIGWNALPVAVYYMRKNQYEADFKAGKHSRPFDSLDSTEKYFSFFGWDLKNTQKSRLDLNSLTYEVLDHHDRKEHPKLHELPAHVLAEKDFESRQEKLEVLRRSIDKQPLRTSLVPGNRYLFPSNAIFEA